MSPKLLSAVLEKKIRRLALTSFPCGNGPWRRAKDGPESVETETVDDLLSLLRHPPFKPEDVSWSPQALPLKQLAVIEPERINKKFIYSYFTTLHILGKNVSIIDEGLLKFSKLEELVLSVNVITEIPAENLPGTLKILELRANRLSSLNGLTNHPPPQLQYLGLGSNNLGSHQDISHLTGRHWPQLLSLDISDCEFKDQQVLLRALSSLPSLKSLTLMGNPFTLAASYPGFTVDSLPQLLILDTLCISDEERCRFRGLAVMSDLMDLASVTVDLSSLRGIPDAPRSLEKTFPIVTCRYFITYQFLSHPATRDLIDNELKLEAASTAPVTEVSSSDADQQPNEASEEQSPRSDISALVSQHSTSELTSSKLMNFRETKTYVTSALGDLKKILNQGLYLQLEEEKILSWPADSKGATVTKANQPEKGKKSKINEELSAKSASTKNKAKEKKGPSRPELVQDAPIRRILGSIHVSLETLVQEGQKVNILCDFGPLQTDDDCVKTVEAEKQEEKESKQEGGSGTKLENNRPPKGKGTKGRGQDVQPDQLEPVTMEVCVELKKWQSASEARRFTAPNQNT